jgi:hypothetical protein
MFFNLLFLFFWCYSLLPFLLPIALDFQSSGFDLHCLACAMATVQLIGELRAHFPQHDVLTAHGIVYPQY